MSEFNITLKTQVGNVTANIESYPSGFGCYYVAEIKEWYILVQGDTLEQTIKDLYSALEGVIEWQQEELLKTIEL